MNSLSKTIDGILDDLGHKAANGAERIPTKNIASMSIKRAIKKELKKHIVTEENGFSQPRKIIYWSDVEPLLGKGK